MDEIFTICDSITIKQLAKHLNVDVSALYRWDKIPNKYHKGIREFMKMQNTRIDEFTENF